MNQLLINEAGRLRSGWRVAVFLFAFIFSVVVLGLIARVGMQAVGVDASDRNGLFLLTNGFVSLLPALILGWICGKYLEGLPMAALGTAAGRRSLVNFLAGLGVGAVTLVITLVPAVIAGGLTFEINQENARPLRYLAISLLIFGVAAAFEEALFRGYIFQTLKREGFAWLAILLTAVFFGALHLGNPSSSIFSTFNTMLAGIWFGVAYLKTRDLWFAWGIHLAWNWVQGSIFGIEVSGLRGLGGEALLREVDSGPTWLTGDVYGLEGGVACTAAILISIGIIYLLPIGVEVREDSAAD